MKFIAVSVALLLSLTLSCSSDEAPSFVEDIAGAMPDNAEVLFENDHAVVTRFTLPPRTALPFHPGKARVVYSLSDYKLEYSISEDTRSIDDYRVGAVRWRSSGNHSVRNVGPITARFLTVERKTPNPTPGVTSNLAEVAPDQAKVVFENEEAKVIEVSLEPGDKLGPHVAASRMVYTLTPAKLKFISDAGEVENDLAEGTVHWHDGGEHHVENLSETPVKYVVFELM